MLRGYLRSGQADQPIGSYEGRLLDNWLFRMSFGVESKRALCSLQGVTEGDSKADERGEGGGSRVVDKGHISSQSRYDSQSDAERSRVKGK